MKLLPSAHPGPRLAVIAILGVLLARPTVAQSTTPTFVQAATFSTGSRVSTVTVTLTQSVAQGDLLVGWVSQYGAAEQVQVSDDVNGAWTRGPGSLRFMDDTGDIALYYRENSQAAPGGLTITVTVSSSAPAFLQGSVADYSGIALAGALDQVASARGIGTTVDTGATAAVDAGELVFAALITGDDPRSVTPGSSAGVQYTPRAQNSNGSAFAEDITSSAAGAQQGTATLGASANWIAVCAVFHAAPTTAPRVPSAPVGLEATSVASTRVALSWSPSSGSVAGYTVYRNGTAIGTTRPDTTIFLDPNVTPATAYTYSVDAFDSANDHSAQSVLAVTTSAQSPEFVQGTAASPADPSTSSTLTLTQPVSAGDLLVGWFSQFGASGQVQVSDSVNGPWTRSVSSTWGGSGDIALFYRQPSAPAPSGLVITVSASAPAYLQEAVADYRHVGALDQAAVSQGTGTYATVGPTATVPAGELVVAAILTGGQPGSAAAGSSQKVPYLIDAQNGSASSDLEDILSSAAGPQEGNLTLGSASNWVMVLATFQSTAGSTTTTSTTTPPTTTSTSTTTTTTRSTTTSTATTRPPTTTTPTSTTTTTTRSTTTSTATTRPPTTTTTTRTTTTSTVPRTTTTARPTTTTQTTTTRPATSTTSRSTTTTTPVQTTTTTTTPLLACGGLYPLCLGSCPPGLTCTGSGLLGTCSCR